MSSSQLPLVLILGPTASGKTAVATELFKRLDCHLISVDSSQVYRGMNIGSAKPDAGELAQTPHALIDIREPWETYSAADFCADASIEVGVARRQQKVPVLVGGTMMYFKALQGGLASMPSADPRIRQQLAADAEQQGWGALHARLAKIDPEAATRIHPNDPQRLQRALEVYLLTGQPISELQRLQSPARLSGPVLSFGLYPQDRAALHAVIGQRFDEMLGLGLIEEVQGLRLDARITRDLPSQRAVGYRQVWDFLEAEIEQADIADKAKAATRQLAKRQLTWMRGMEDLINFDSHSQSSSDIAATIEKRWQEMAQ